jgi:hypothetical protein
LITISNSDNSAKEGIKTVRQGERKREKEREREVGKERKRKEKK